MVPPESLKISSEQMPSPPIMRTFMPSCFIWRSIGPAVALRPPKKTRSGLVARMRVTMALKSVALSLVNSRATIVPPCCCRLLENSITRPWP